MPILLQGLSSHQLDWTALYCYQVGMYHTTVILLGRESSFFKQIRKQN
jgi:hypothetical protein